MGTRKRNPLSISSEIHAESELKREPRGLVKKKAKKEAHGAYNRALRSVVQAEWEAGENVSLLASRHSVSERTIHRWSSKYNWERSNDATASAILEHARAEIRRKIEMQKVEVQTSFEDVLIRHRAATATLGDMLNEAMSRALAYPHKDPFRQMLIIKVASEVSKNIQSMDRKTFNMDDSKTTRTTTAIFEVLENMEDNVDKLASGVENGKRTT